MKSKKDLMVLENLLSKYGKDIKFNDMSKKLALHINVIQDALKYWESVGVLTKKTTGYILNNLREFLVILLHPIDDVNDHYAYNNVFLIYLLFLYHS